MNKEVELYEHNGKQYVKLNTAAGINVYQAYIFVIAKMNDLDKLCCMEFNGEIIYSDEDSLDSAYMKVVGRTYSEHLKKIEEEEKRMKEAEEEYERSKPSLYSELIMKGHEIIDEKYWFTFDKLVAKSLDDLYRGYDIECAVHIVKMLKEKKSFEEIRQTIFDQGHSNWSVGITIAEVKDICDEGSDFYNKFWNNVATNLI